MSRYAARSRKARATSALRMRRHLASAHRACQAAFHASGRQIVPGPEPAGGDTQGSPGGIEVAGAPGMIPRVHEAIGLPLPGTTGVLPASPVGKDFRRLLDGLLHASPQTPAQGNALARLPESPTPGATSPTPS